MHMGVVDPRHDEARAQVMHDNVVFARGGQDRLRRAHERKHALGRHDEGLGPWLLLVNRKHAAVDVGRGVFEAGRGWTRSHWGLQEKKSFTSIHATFASFMPTRLFAGRRLPPNPRSNVYIYVCKMLIILRGILPLPKFRMPGRCQKQPTCGVSATLYWTESSSDTSNQWALCLFGGQAYGWMGRELPCTLQGTTWVASADASSTGYVILLEHNSTKPCLKYTKDSSLNWLAFQRHSQLSPGLGLGVDQSGCVDNGAQSATPPIHLEIRKSVTAWG